MPAGYWRETDRTRFDPGGVNIPSTDPDPTTGDGTSSTPNTGLNTPTFAGTQWAGRSGRETTTIGMDPSDTPLVGNGGGGGGGLPFGTLAVLGAAALAVISLMES